MLYSMFFNLNLYAKIKDEVKQKSLYAISCY